MNFDEFGLHPDLLEGLDAMNFRETTPIQERSLPVILDGKDLIACAQTGTGKTAAYILPVIDNILKTGHRGLNTLVLAPTRELAKQIDQQIDGFTYFVDISSISIYGGGDGVTWGQQRKALDEGVDIIIATPGRLLSFLTLVNRKLPELKHLVLDEADRMLDMGFYDDIINIVKAISAERQTLMFSATMPPRIRELARNIMQKPVEINIAVSAPASGITQKVYRINDENKSAFTRQILSDEELSSILIFASTKEKVRMISGQLKQADLSVKAFHSDLEQNVREEILRDFRNRKIRIIVGTDVLSRGIDIENISLVLNYDTPSDPEDYVHRVGRTARAERKGMAITFVNSSDYESLDRIEKLIGYPVPVAELPAEFGPPSVRPAKKKGEGFRGRRKKGPGKGNRRKGYNPKGKRKG